MTEKAPNSAAVQWVVAPEGAVLVWDDCQEPPPGVDDARLRAAIDRAYRRGARENPEVVGLPLTGAIVFLTNQLPPGERANHAYHPAGWSFIRISCGNDHLLAHELAHRFAEQLDLPCSRVVQHPPPKGRNLACEKY